MPARNNREIATMPDVTRAAVPMEQRGKHVSAETNSHNNQKVVFSVRSMSTAYKKDKEDRLSRLNFETPACQDMGLGVEQLRHQNY
jgi:hypothetical protein